MTAHVRPQSQVLIRPAYRLVLTPLPDCADAERAIKALLKAALRRHRLRCVSLEKLQPSEATP
jgi:hypothetical protein